MPPARRLIFLKKALTARVVGAFFYLLWFLCNDDESAA